MYKNIVESQVSQNCVYFVLWKCTLTYKHPNSLEFNLILLNSGCLGIYMLRPRKPFEGFKVKGTDHRSLTNVFFFLSVK